MPDADQGKPGHERTETKTKADCKRCTTHYKRHWSWHLLSVWSRYIGMYPRISQTPRLTQIQLMQLNLTTISPNQYPNRWSRDNYVKSINNLMIPTKEILKTTHNDKCKDYPIRCNPKKESSKPNIEKEKLYREQNIYTIEITQLRHWQYPPLGSFNKWKN